MDRSLDSLSSGMYTRGCEWIARCAARGIPVLVVQTSRTPAEHQLNLANGTSKTALSLHLPRALRWPAGVAGPLEPEKCDAMDVVPFLQFSLYGPDKLQWDTQDQAWQIIGEECERVGLRWGGRWHTPFDPGHGELILPGREALAAEERARPFPTFRAG